MEARIQTLTEDNDLLRRENQLNNGWVENQQGLAKALETVDTENKRLKEKNKEFLETNKEFLEKNKELEAIIKAARDDAHRIANARIAAPGEDEEQRMHFNQGSINRFFNSASAHA